MASINEQIAEELANDYVKYFQVDTFKHKLQLEELIEELLSQLEEFCSIVEEVRQNSNALESSLNKLSEQDQTLQAVYQQIDTIEEYLTDVSGCFDELDNALKALQAPSGSLSAIKRYLMKIPVFLPSFSVIQYEDTAAPGQSEEEQSESVDSKSIVGIVVDINRRCRDLTSALHTKLQQ